MPYTVPFAYPIAPTITISQADNDFTSTLAQVQLLSPCVKAFTHRSDRPRVIDQEFSGAHSDRSTPTGTAMPSPPIHDVVPSRYDCRIDFQMSVIVYHLGLSTILPAPLRPIFKLRQSKAPKAIPTTDYHDLTYSLSCSETLPLLSRPASPKTAYLNPPSNPTPHIGTDSPSSSARPLGSSARTLQSSIPRRLRKLGWTEYRLPDNTVYYVHPTRRITTDIDMREDKMLDRAVALLKRKVVPPGLELWFREREHTKKAFFARMFWVDHGRRTVVHHQGPRHGGWAETANDDCKGLISNGRQYYVDYLCF